MHRLWPAALLLVFFGARAEGVEERIRGVLEKTARPNACAQITDALNDIYYVVKTVASEKSCAPLIGRRVVLSGTVEERGEARVYFLTLKRAEAYRPKQSKQSGTSSSVSLPPAKTGTKKKE